MSGVDVDGVEALVLRRVPYAESDWILSLLTRTEGQVPAIAQGARASRRRFAGSLEPFHEIRCRWVRPRSGELVRLRDAQLSRPRHQLVSSLPAMLAAGTGLGWTRRALSPFTAEPAVWRVVGAWLDGLDASPPATSEVADARLGDFGLALLTALGWGLELSSCVACTRPCPSQAPASIDPRRGGLICRSCGGAAIRLEASLRQRMLLASRTGEVAVLPGDAPVVLGIVEAALKIHVGIDDTSRQDQ